MGRGVMAYETFAFVYDEVMDSSLYKKWLDFSCRHLGKRKQLLELACGTGALAVEFAKAGFDVTGLDLSEEMLIIASQRAEKEEAAVQFVAGDMLDLVDVGTYQAITCYSDSLCYMEDEQSVQQVFDGVYSCLEEDGVFLFDVHSLYQIDEVFPDYSYHYQTDEFAFSTMRATGILSTASVPPGKLPCMEENEATRRFSPPAFPLSGGIHRI